MELITSKLRAAFDEQVNNFSKLENCITGDNYIKKSAIGPIITLYFLVNGEKEELLPSNPIVEGHNDFLTITYNEFGGKKVSVVLTIIAVEDQLRFSAVIDNNDDVEIVEILMPRIGGIYLGDDYRDDAIIYPHHAGEKTLNPVRGYGYDKKDFWRASSVAYINYFRREINYCGLASMSWMYYFDTDNGLYIGSHDSRFPVTGIIAETSGDESDPWMGFAFRKYHRILKGQQYKTGEYVLAITIKDWHYGAKLYRSYIEKYLDFKHTPAFLDDEYALNQCYNFKRNNIVESYFADIPRLYDTGKEWDVRHIFMASWNRSGFDTDYPEYYPDMELGSAMEFRRGLEYVRKNGGFTTLYINARIFSISSDFHKQVGQKMAIRNPKGELIYEQYGPVSFSVNCPSDKLWREYLIDTAEFAFKAYGCDGIYLDQLASAEPFACFCKDHSHEGIEEFNNGYVYVLKELLRRLKETNPEAYLMTENCGDIYGSYTWGNLTWNGADYDEFYNVFKFTFPEFVQVNMVNPRGWENESDKKYTWFYKDICRAITLGSVLWMGITTRLRPEDGEYHTYAKKALNFRKNLQPLIKQAEFIDDKFINEYTQGCFVTSWKLDDGRIMIIAGNPDEKTCEVGLIVPPGKDKVKVYNMSWKENMFAAEGENTKVAIDGKSMVCILL